MREELSSYLSFNIRSFFAISSIAFSFHLFSAFRNLKVTQMCVDNVTRLSPLAADVSHLDTLANLPCTSLAREVASLGRLAVC